MSEVEKRTRIVNRADLATICNVSLPTVDTWVRKGCPVIERGSKGKEWQFDSAAIIDWRIKIAIEESASGLGEDEEGKITRDEADRRKAVAGAIIAEVDADQALASVVSRFDAETTLADFAQALRAAFSNTAARIAGRAATLTDPNEIREFCEAEFNRSFEAGEAVLDEKWENGTGHGDADSGEDFGA